MWKYNSKGVYTVKSFYEIINFRGIIPPHAPAIWHLKIPPRAQIFIWLVCNNKVLTRDNLRDRRCLT